MLSRQGLKIHHKRALGILRISHPSARSASFATPDLLKTLRPATNYRNLPLHLLDNNSPSTTTIPPQFLHQFGGETFFPLASSSSSTSTPLKISAKSDDSDPVDSLKPKRERKKRESPTIEQPTPSDGGEKSEIQKKPESDKSNSSKPTSSSDGSKSKSSSNPTAPPSNNDDGDAPPPLPPRVKTPNDQKGGPTEKLYQAASASDKKQVMILPINRRPLIPGKSII